MLDKTGKKELHLLFFRSGGRTGGISSIMLCIPEPKPGATVIDASSALARKAEKLIEENCGANQSLELLARKLGCISRYLRRVFMEEYHVAPIQYLQTYRLLLAKNLLTDTALPVLEVAMAAGFGSLR